MRNPKSTYQAARLVVAKPNPRRARGAVPYLFGSPTGSKQRKPALTAGTAQAQLKKIDTQAFKGSVSRMDRTVEVFRRGGGTVSRRYKTAAAAKSVYDRMNSAGAAQRFRDRYGTKSNPRRDGTGPAGRGPRTGRGMGPCRRNPAGGKYQALRGFAMSYADLKKAGGMLRPMTKREIAAETLRLVGKKALGNWGLPTTVGGLEKLTVKELNSIPRVIPFSHTEAYARGKKMKKNPCGKKHTKKNPAGMSWAAFEKLAKEHPETMVHAKYTSYKQTSYDTDTAGRMWNMLRKHPSAYNIVINKVRSNPSWTTVPYTMSWDSGGLQYTRKAKAYMLLKGDTTLEVVPDAEYGWIASIDGVDLFSPYKTLAAAKKAVLAEWEKDIKKNPEKKTMSIKYYDDTAEAYDFSQSLPRGTILVIKSEKVVGLSDAWPVAITQRSGSLHAMIPGVPLSSHYDHDGKRIYTNAQIKKAEEVAKKLGYPIRKDILAKAPLSKTPRAGGAGRMKTVGKYVIKIQGRGDETILVVPKSSRLGAIGQSKYASASGAERAFKSLKSTSDVTRWLAAHPGTGRGSGYGAGRTTGNDGTKLRRKKGRSTRYADLPKPYQHRKKTRTNPCGKKHTKKNPTQGYRYVFTFSPHKTKSKRLRWIRYGKNMEAALGSAKRAARADYPHAHGFLIKRDN